MKIDKNILFEPLFGDYETFYPLFNIHATVDFEDEQYSKVLGDLKFPYFIFDHYFLVIILLFLFTIILSAGCLFGAYKLNKVQTTNEQELLLDTDNIIL